jgi:predicted transcriptional regulator
MAANEANPDLTAEIVSKYVSHHKVPVDQLPELIEIVYQAISRLEKPHESEGARTPVVSVRKSIRHDYVVCLDCGHRGLVLRGHIRVRHGLNPDEYRKRWGLKRDHALTAPAYSEQRSSMSKALGLGRRPANPAIEVGKSEAAPAPVDAVQESAATSKPVRKARGAAKRAEASEPAVTPSKPARARRSLRTASQPEQPASPTD